MNLKTMWRIAQFAISCVAFYLAISKFGIGGLALVFGYGLIQFVGGYIRAKL